MAFGSTIDNDSVVGDVRTARIETTPKASSAKQAPKARLRVNQINQLVQDFSTDNSPNGKSTLISPGSSMLSPWDGHAERSMNTQSSFCLT
ncbi:hypothetical protein PM082_015563 [Marasmius tenuissimus]|nr:hypothetical protein PM082_015563 [Marasmius tenuissimus]